MTFIIKLMPAFVVRNHTVNDFCPGSVLDTDLDWLWSNLASRFFRSQNDEILMVHASYFALTTVHSGYS